MLARELERIGVRVNAIAPVARTRLTEALAGDYMKADEAGFDRFSPANVAAVACWLASDDAAGISGQVVKVQGGQLQLLEGWRPLTEVTDDTEWTLDTVGDVPARTRKLLEARSPGPAPSRRSSSRPRVSRMQDVLAPCRRRSRASRTRPT